MNHDESEGPCPHCLIAGLAVALGDGQGYFAQPAIASATKALLIAWANHDRAVHAAYVHLTIGCPTCGARADEWCTSRSGKPYDLTYGDAYVHAARRRELADLTS